MTPDQSRSEIQHNYYRMVSKSQLSEINESCIYRNIELQARAAASRHGVPECWRDLMPITLLEKGTQ